ALDILLKPEIIKDNHVVGAHGLQRGNRPGVRRTLQKRACQSSASQKTDRFFNQMRSPDSLTVNATVKRNDSLHRQYIAQGRFAVKVRCAERMGRGEKRVWSAPTAEG